MLLQHLQTYVMFLLDTLVVALIQALLSGSQFTNTGYNKCELAVQKELSMFTYDTETWLLSYKK